VEELCTNCRGEFFLTASSLNLERTHIGGADSRASSLALPAGVTRICALLVHEFPSKNFVTPIRITQTIHGRSYVIEVRAVAQDRWRAQVARTPTGMTSLMPFYGTTPDEAAQHLAGWLTRAGGGPRKAL
jgi:hypothetical protein